MRTTPLAGWSVTTNEVPLNPPLKDDDGNAITKTIGSVTWKANPGNRIAPGQYLDFPLSLGPFPDDVDVIRMPAVQTYDNGKVVNWADPPAADGSEARAPRPVGLADRGDHAATARRPDATATPAEPPPPTTPPPAGWAGRACSSARSASASAAARCCAAVGWGSRTDAPRGGARAGRGAALLLAPLPRGRTASSKQQPGRRRERRHAAARVSLTFNEDVQPGFTVITLIGPTARTTTRGNVTETDHDGQVGALPLGPAGCTRSATGSCPPTGTRCRARSRSR